MATLPNPGAAFASGVSAGTSLNRNNLAGLALEQEQFKTLLAVRQKQFEFAQGNVDNLTAILRESFQKGGAPALARQVKLLDKNAIFTFLSRQFNLDRLTGKPMFEGAGVDPQRLRAGILARAQAAPTPAETGAGELAEARAAGGLTEAEGRAASATTAAANLEVSQARLALDAREAELSRFNGAEFIDINGETRFLTPAEIRAAQEQGIEVKPASEQAVSDISFQLITKIMREGPESLTPNERAALDEIKNKPAIDALLRQLAPGIAQ